MATALGFQPHISVDTTLGDRVSYLAITVTVLPSFLSCPDIGFDILYKQPISATLQDIQHPDPIGTIVLEHPDDGTLGWKGFRMIEISSSPCPRKLTLDFWSHSSMEESEKVMIGSKDLTFFGPLKVSWWPFLAGVIVDQFPAAAFCSYDSNKPKRLAPAQHKLPGPRVPQYEKQ